MASQKPQRASLQTIASHVGTTRMTVSRCLRAPETVSQPLRDRILVAVRELNYVPNRAPKLLAQSRSFSIGVLVPSVTNQVFADVLAGIIDATENTEIRTMIAHYGYSREKEERQIAALLSYNTDALILSDRDHTDTTLRMIEAAHVPVVEIMDTRLPALQQAVGYDNQDAAHSIVARMIAEGRRNIVCLALRLDERTRQRELGYRTAMDTRDLTPRVLRSAQKSSFSIGAAMMHELLDSQPRIDGVFCTNDDIAVGAYFACVSRGLDVPGQMRIAGFHGLDVSRALQPRLATVLTPRYRIGERATVELLHRIDGVAAEEAVIDLGFEILFEPGA
ncbi:MAG: substrate-binding domain-containing protein [Roseinatronobacter sp.]